uniref:Acetylglutamate kinase n=1 Tax=Cyanidium caldarium TaxID=2771 RepID=ARGB_CYACA|nr:acetylglutamate kinase [Cyanidium caldarium]Q9TLT0.1 RecName: Full=Acetylglutamate kinase; AltName: Full=N-acetyl-L-glutamate 5-phosphotransferase; AltName: Full=NAG kinase; Short=NAGK [Cyanidium caldarium]AAF12905.1 unknown [Cyanidium caldarium]
MNNKSIRTQILIEALPYIQQFRGAIFVIKYGGAAMKDLISKERLIADIVFLSCIGLKLVCVHGGGPEINFWLNKMNVESKFHDGIRITDELTMQVVEMVLAGKINKELVSLLNNKGVKGVGLCGKDGTILTARKAQCGSIDMGLVGEIKSVDPYLILTLLKENYIPVIASVGADETGKTYNINADFVAGEIAASLGAEKLILVTNTSGILADVSQPESLIRDTNIMQLRQLLSRGIISKGMIPKVNCSIRSLAQGVRAVHIIDGTKPHSLLLEVLTNNGIGTRFLYKQSILLQLNCFSFSNVSI